MVARISKAVIFLLVALVSVQCCNQYDYDDLINRVQRLDKGAYSYENPYHDFMVLKDEAFKQLFIQFPTPKLNHDAKIQESVCVGICVRNCERFLANSFSRLEGICSCFLRSYIIFYENGSSDDSRKKLMRYCNLNEHATLINGRL